MRSTAVVCVALGGMLMLFSFVPIVMAENALQRWIGLGFAGLIALPLLTTGLVLTRRFAAKHGPEAEAAASEEFFRRGRHVLAILTAGHIHFGKVDADGRAGERLRAFDIDSLTAAGWTLVIAACGFFLAEVLVFRALTSHIQGDIGPLGAIAALAMAALAALFFVIGKKTMSACGIAFTNEKKGPNSE